jgi:hypothetical protein
VTVSNPHKNFLRTRHKLVRLPHRSGARKNEKGEPNENQADSYRKLKRYNIPAGNKVATASR